MYKLYLINKKEMNIPHFGIQELMITARFIKNKDAANRIY